MRREEGGVLYVVATPIGNLEDVTTRARRILGEVDLIAAEDTRRTRQLLSALGLSGELVSLNDHNERDRIPGLIAQMQAGRAIALVSDAGVPTVSDPGFPLIRAAADAGLPVVPIPGPSAVTAALSVAGLPTDRFLFLGFLPPKQARRRKALAALANEPGTIVLFEAPGRVLDLLADVEATLGARRVVVGRELTKLHEEILRGTPAEVSERLSSEGGERLRGEMTVLIEGLADGAEAPPPSTAHAEAPRGLKDLAEEAARILGVPKRAAYQALLALKGGEDG